MKTLNWKSRFAICSVVLLSFAMIATPQAKADPVAICVPWNTSDPEYNKERSRHYTYDGAQITLKGIARGDTAQYRWVFGDGGRTGWTAITDPYNLGVKHTYSGVAGKRDIVKCCGWIFFGLNIRSRFADWFYLFISPASEARFIDNLVAQ